MGLRALAPDDHLAAVSNTCPLAEPSDDRPHVHAETPRTWPKADSEGQSSRDAKASVNTRVWTSTSSAACDGDMRAMLWKGVRSTPRLRANKCM